MEDRSISELELLGHGHSCNLQSTEAMRYVERIARNVQISEAVFDLLLTYHLLTVFDLIQVK